MFTAPIAGASPTRSAPGALPHDAGVSPTDDIGALLLAIGEGDVRAFDTLYQQTARRVYALVRRVLADADMSAETTQDVFLALWQGGPGRYDPALGTGMTWLLSIAHRRAVDRVRAEESHRARTRGRGIRNQDIDHDQVADTVMQRVETDAVQAGPGTLSAVQHEAIRLAYYAGMTYAEVAEQLDIPVPTARTRIRDGMRRLGTSLQGAG